MKNAILIVLAGLVVLWLVKRYQVQNAPVPFLGKEEWDGNYYIM